ncbi:MAG: threonine synthase [Patescibacteria group bacterium]|nr:threonine synthase [Patescibacteria group bacterium]
MSVVSAQKARSRSSEMKGGSHLRCASCGDAYQLKEPVVHCRCGGLLDVAHDLSRWHGRGEGLKALFRSRLLSGKEADASGVWRFRELVLPGFPLKSMVTRGEGNTRHYSFRKTGEWMGQPNVVFKHEGENPTGSFKDRGMTVAVSRAKADGAKRVVCASTGNTAAAVASYASLAGLPSAILIPENATALGKISQSLAYGATTIKIRGDFDAALRLVMESREKLGLTVLNSVNPFRLEGQKTIMFEALERMGWNPPDWIVVPGGNLGNTSAFGKAFTEAKEIGLIDRLPRIAVIQAEGASPFFHSYSDGWKPYKMEAETVATAIRIGDPVNRDKAVRAVDATDGLVASVTDTEIMDAKAIVDSDGVGAEPASCTSAAGIRKLVAEGVIKRDERVLAILTGNLLKDPDATIKYHSESLPDIMSASPNRPVTIDPTARALEKVLSS